MRYFNSMIFLGSGEASVRSADALHERLRQGLHMLGGMQQGPNTPEEVEEADAFLRDVLHDISVALLGRKVFIFDDKLPYPSPTASADDHAQHELVAKTRADGHFDRGYAPSGCTCAPHVLHRMIECGAHRMPAYICGQLAEGGECLRNPRHTGECGPGDPKKG